MRGNAKRAGMRSVALLLGVLLLLSLAAALLAPVEARAEGEEGYWKQTDAEFIASEPDSMGKYTISDGSATQSLYDPNSGDSFKSSATWSSPKGTYKGGEEVSLQLKVWIESYVWKGEEGPYIHDGLNYCKDYIQASIDEAGLRGAVTAGRINLTQKDGTYTFEVYTDYGKQAVSTNGGTVSAKFPAGYKSGELKAIYVKSKGGVACYTYTWVAGAEPPVVPPPGQTTEETTTPAGKGGRKIPGPGNWWIWLTGTVIAGIIATIIGFINSLLGLPAVPVTPNIPPGFGFPPGMEPLPGGIAGGTADPFDLQKYPNQPGYTSIADTIREELDIAGDAIGMTALDTGTALKDGVAGFFKGLASIPILVLEGYGQIGRLLATAHTEFTRGGPGVFSDMFSPSVAWDTLKNAFGPLGKEILPIEEFQSFFDPNASMEEKLWAIPSAAIKLANLIMMSESLATKPVPGLDPNFTFIKSAKPGLAIEAAVKGANPATKADYEAYRAAAKQKASEISRTVESGGKLTREQVLEAMSDPATMRNIKKAPKAVQEEFAAAQAKEVYNPVYDDMIDYMKIKDPNGTYRVGGVRTPGQKSLVNTDNDVVIEKLVTTEDGVSYWKEVPAHEWEGAYYDSFARRTGFSPEKAKARFPEKDWDNMTLREKTKAWTEGHGQECMDVKNPEAAQSFSNQPTVMDPQWKPGGKSPVADGRIVDGEGLYNMEKFKTTRGWKGEGTTLKTQTEAMEQGCKLCDLSKKMADASMKRTGKPMRYPEIFKQGEEILKRRDLPPAVRDQALKNIGFKGGYEDFMDKLSSWTGRLP
ncbi:MAG: hypothetical protein HPY75_14965 [Actinobacteria bacterium]|nr:hypothetical protein [Actinomycetota bacterium]